MSNDRIRLADKIGTEPLKKFWNDLKKYIDDVDIAILHYHNIIENHNIE